MRLVFNGKALADLGNIHRWIDANSPASADRTIERLFASVETLLIFPNIGHPGHDPGTLEWVIPRTPYIVVYEPKFLSDELRVIAVLHQAQQRD